MRTICEQYLSKGPRALYHVALRERDDGRVELFYRWDNAKSVDSRTTLCDSERTGRKFFDQKLQNLMERGYERSVRPVPMRDQAVAPPAPAAPAAAEMGHALTKPPARDPESLTALIEKRRKEASWSLG